MIQKLKKYPWVKILSSIIIICMDTAPLHMIFIYNTFQRNDHNFWIRMVKMIRYKLYQHYFYQYISVGQNNKKKINPSI